MSYYDDYNDKHNFTFRLDSNDGERHLEMNCNEIYLGDIFARFKEFLQGCGYEINGDIDVIEYNSAQDEQPKFDFSNVPNNSWPFGESKPASVPKHSEHEHSWYQWNNSYSLTSANIPALTTFDLSSFTVTDLSTLTTKSWTEWSAPTMAPLTTEQIQSWSMEMPGTLGGAKVSRGNYGNDAY